MPCITCLRRNRPCNEQRPRCTACKASHLRCAYDGPPSHHEFRNEFQTTTNQYSSVSPSSNPGTVDSGLLSQAVQGDQLTPSQQQFAVVQETSMVDIEPGGMFSDSFDDVTSPQFSSWADDFYQTFSLDEPTYPDFDFSNLLYPQIRNQFSQMQNTTPFSNSLNAGNEHWKSPSTSTAAEPTMNDDSRPIKMAKLDSLPVPLLAQHFSRQLTARYSFKTADWTFYTYFFHRFTNSHPWVLSSILAWSSAHLYYSKKADNLDSASRHYSECVSHISEQFGRSLDHISSIWPSNYDPVYDHLLSDAETDDIDAILVAYFFLALFDLITARPQQIRKILRFVSHVLRIPNVKINMGGVRSRVSTWFCILDAKASAFQHGDGAVLDAIGGQDGVAAALNASFTTLQQVYSVTYPDEERKGDETQRPLLERMLRLMALLGDIAKCKEDPVQSKIDHIRGCLDIHAEELDVVALTQTFEGRNRPTWLVLQALYNAIEIAFSRAFFPTLPRHSADIYAIKTIRFAQQLNTLRNTPYSNPPQTKIWPLPIVLAAIEVRDPIYGEWVLEKMRGYETTSGDHYVYAKKFIEKMWEAEGIAGRRVDYDVVMREVKDGLVI